MASHASTGTLNRCIHFSFQSSRVTNSFIIDARRYFKQSEIALFRQAPEIAATPQIAQQQQIQQQVLLQQQQQALPPGSATAGPGREVTPIQPVQQPQQTQQPVSAPAA